VSPFGICRPQDIEYDSILHAVLYSNTRWAHYYDVAGSDEGAIRGSTITFPLAAPLGSHRRFLPP
jgi:hypothetical protein